MRIVPNILTTNGVLDWSSLINVEILKLVKQITSWPKYQNTLSRQGGFIYLFMYLFNKDSLHAKLSSHYETWSYKKKKHTKIKAYRKYV